MFLVNSCLGLFSAASLRRLPFFRSYGVNLPSSLTTLLPLALGFSPHLPVSVCGTGTLVSPRAFLAFRHRGLRYYTFAPLRPALPFAGFRYPKVSLWLKVRWSRNFYRVCIAYAFRPELSSRLTLGGRTFPRKPEIFGHYDSHIILATHSGILSSVPSTAAFAAASSCTERSPTTPAFAEIPGFGFMLSPVTFSARSHSTSELLRTLLMNGCF